MYKKTIFNAIILMMIAFCLGFTVALYKSNLTLFIPRTSSDIAAWVGAFGSIGAVVAAIWIMHRQHIQSEQRLFEERAHTTQKEINAQQDRILVCLMVVAHTATGIITTLDLLEKTNESELPWTLPNQAKAISMTLEPSLHIPMHELEKIELVRLVFTVVSLAQRVSDCIAVWSRCTDNPSAYIPDLRKTVALLKSEGAEAFSAIEKTIIAMRN